ncbi:MAG: hypothetical protein KKF62_00325 [Bacteroidetes bacterium]|nr:hypothetical protein [Bacteroidota bacterium]MBU1117261.1 hypothetical protein [Bacteroidota bacterium]MBU1797410.1 hypothetical protein [Bacteroidota bacterium]
MVIERTKNIETQNTPLLPTEIRNKIISLLVIFLFTTNIYSQEIGVAPVKVWTNNYEIENPYGFSIYVFQPLGRLGIKFEYLTAQNERNYYGFLNGGFLVKPEDFIKDSITSKSSSRAFEISLIMSKIAELFGNHFNIGAGVTYDKFSRDKIGLSSGKVFRLSESKYGLFYALSISRENILGFPIKLELLFKHKGLKGGIFATDTEQPFTGSMDVKELQVNLAFMF